MTTERVRITVSIYEEEFETVVKFLKIDVCTAQAIREAFGLKATGKRIGYNTKIREALSDKLKEMSDEEKEGMLAELGGEEEAEE